MTIDWTAFTPWSALAGGLLIGLASALFVLGNGRIAGIAGIVGSPLRALLAGASLAPERTRLLFIGGLLVAIVGLVVSQCMNWWFKWQHLKLARENAKASEDE